MKKLLAILTLLLLPIFSYAQDVTNPQLNIREVDGNPSIYPYRLVVDNNTLTQPTTGIASYSIASYIDSISGSFLKLDGTNTPAANYSWTTNLTTTGNLQASGNTVTSTFKDSTGTVGQPDQVLSSQAGGVTWKSISLAETDTLDTVTTRGATTANSITVGGITTQGIASGSTVTASHNLNVKNLNGLLKATAGSVGVGTAGVDYLAAEVDGVIGNEVTDTANTTLARSGAGTNGDPYKLALNIGNANTWTDTQTFGTASGSTVTVSHSLTVDNLNGVIKGTSGLLSNAISGTDYEPPVTKGNLTAGSTKITIGGTGTGALIGVGASVDVNQANLDHGSIGGLADDDHTQYLLANGTRALAGNWSAGGNNITSIGTASGSTVTASHTLNIGNLNGILKGTAGVVSVATAGTDYIAAETDPNAIYKNGTVDLTGNWTISNNNITLTNGTLTSNNATTNQLHIASGLSVSSYFKDKDGDIGISGQFLKSLTGQTDWTFLADADIPNTITLDNITQITTKSHTSLSDIGTNTHASIDTHIADSSDPHGATLTQTNITVNQLTQASGVSVSSFLKDKDGQVGISGQVLTSVAGQVDWQSTAAGGVTSVTGTSPISSSGGATPDISIANAVADGATKGAASFTAADFNDAAGNISIDYTNGQAATAANKGFLTSANWSTFNAKADYTFGSNNYYGTGSFYGVNIGFTGTASGPTVTVSGLTTASGISVSSFFKDKDGQTGIGGQVLVSVAGQTDWQTFNQMPIQQTTTPDHSVQGITMKIIAGEALVFGDLVYFKSDGKVWKADATTTATIPAIGLATNTIGANATGDILIYGSATDATWAWATVGGMLYATTTAGSMSQTQPSATDQVIQTIGIATSATTIIFKPNLDYMTHI